MNAVALASDAATAAAGAAAAAIAGGECATATFVAATASATAAAAAYVGYSLAQCIPCARHSKAGSHRVALHEHRSAEQCPLHVMV